MVDQVEEVVEEMQLLEVVVSLDKGTVVEEHMIMISLLEEEVVELVEQELMRIIGMEEMEEPLQMVVLENYPQLMAQLFIMLVVVEGEVLTLEARVQLIAWGELVVEVLIIHLQELPILVVEVLVKVELEVLEL